MEETLKATGVNLTWTQIDTSPDQVRGYFRGYRVSCRLLPLFTPICMLSFTFTFVCFIFVYLYLCLPLLLFAITFLSLPFFTFTIITFVYFTFDCFYLCLCRFLPIRHPSVFSYPCLFSFTFVYIYLQFNLSTFVHFTFMYGHLIETTAYYRDI